MKTIWLWSYKQEAKRIAYACANIANGFYTQQGYTVLPASTPTPSPTTTIYLPDINYNSIPRYWDTISRVDFQQTQSLKDSVIMPVVNPLASRLKLSGIKEPSSHPIQKIWNTHSAIIMHELCLLIGIKYSDIKTLTIHPTQYGSNASFDIVRHMPADIKIELRLDQGIRSLVSVIILALLTNPLTTTHQATWKQIKFLSEWIITESPLSKLLSKVDPLPYASNTKLLGGKAIRNKPYKVSSDFVRSIGAPTNTKQKFLVTDNQILYNNNAIVGLTSRETLVLTSLINKREKIFTIDEMADLLFTNPDDYSLTTITKTIQHLRDKLEKNGISASTIKTVYGKGYLLT